MDMVKWACLPVNIVSGVNVRNFLFPKLYVLKYDESFESITIIIKLLVIDPLQDRSLFFISSSMTPNRTFIEKDIIINNSPLIYKTYQILRSFFSNNRDSSPLIYTNNL
jgi:hypothetical protein